MSTRSDRPESGDASGLTDVPPPPERPDQRGVDLPDVPGEGDEVFVEAGRWDVVLSAIHAANSMIVIADARADDQPLVFVNEFFCRFTGYDRDEVIGRNCRFLQDRGGSGDGHGGGGKGGGGRDGDQPGLDVIRRAVAAGEPCVTLLRNYKKDGTLFWNELYLSPLRGEDGEPAFFVGVQNDVTDRVGANRERRVLSGALKNLDDSVVITGPELDDPGPVIRYVNDAFERITGYAAAEAVGKTPRILQGPETDRDELDRMRRELAAGGRFRGETVNYRKDGGRFVNEWTVAPIHADAEPPAAGAAPGGGGAEAGAGGSEEGGSGTGDGPPTHWVSSQRDVTEQRAIQRELRVRKELEGHARVQARVARDLHDGPAQDAAATVLLAGALASLLGLDPSNPDALRAAAGDGAPGEGGDLIREVAARLVEQARVTARGVREVSHGLATVEPVRGGLCRALRRAADLVGEFAEGVTATFRGDPADEPDDPDVYDDLYRLAREAVGNAVRHGGASAVAVTLGRAADGREVVLEVVDDGRGVPADLAAAASGETDWPPGRGGLGLRSMRHRAELLGGTLAVARRPADGPARPAPADDGEPCGGTRVAVRFPAARRGGDAA